MNSSIIPRIGWGFVIGTLLFIGLGGQGHALEGVALQDGRLYVDGEWVFLKIAKPLRDFSHEGQVNALIADLDILAAKGYNCITLNCYWHHFDHTGDGNIDVSLGP